MEQGDKVKLYSSLKHNTAFIEYMGDLKYEFDKRYIKLRKTNRDSAFYKTQGFLDALEFAMNLVDNVINEPQPDEGGSEKE